MQTWLSHSEQWIVIVLSAIAERNRRKRVMIVFDISRGTEI